MHAQSPVYYYSFFTMNDYIDFNALVRGDEQAFTSLFHCLYPPVCRAAFTLLRSPQEAEDVAVEAFVALWEKRRSITSLAHARYFLFRVSRNTCLNLLRSCKRKQQRISENCTTTVSPSGERRIMESELAQELRQALSKLPPQCCVICSSFFIQEKSYHEISREMGLAISTVRNQVARGVKLIRNMKEW
jgi:RNA polymerase sigma-70 factor (ECF subfamily)